MFFKQNPTGGTAGDQLLPDTAVLAQSGLIIAQGAVYRTAVAPDIGKYRKLPPGRWANDQRIHWAPNGRRPARCVRIDQEENFHGHQ